MPPAKKLIEVALPLDAINQASVSEKSNRHGRPSTLHGWWAGRPLAAARAVIFTSLVDDPEDPNAASEFVEACRQLNYKGFNVSTKGDSPRMRLFDFIEELVTWKATTDDEIMEQARELISIATKGNPPPLLDPFAGGGSIPLEAQRLGLEAHASDLNPVAVMINKALIEIPSRFANMPPVHLTAPTTPAHQDAKDGSDRRDTTWNGATGLAADVHYYGEWMREQAIKDIGNLYPKHNGETVSAWLWARTVTCPNPACRSTMPLVSSFHLSKKKRVWIEPHPDPQAKKVRFEVRRGEGKVPKSPKVGRGAKFNCLVCGELAPEQYIKDESTGGRMGAQLITIVTVSLDGRNYHSPTPEQSKTAESAVAKWKPEQEMNRDTTDLVSGRGYGFYYWSDLFTARQLTALTTFSDLVHKARKKAKEDALQAGLADDDVPLREGGRGARAYSEAVGVYLSIAVNKGADNWSTICSWIADRETLRGTFARQAIPMVWDYVEANPFSSVAGSWSHTVIDNIVKTIARLPTVPSGNAFQQDATRLQGNAITLSTDPPYYDNISYADLSDYYYLWMRKNLRDIYPDIFSTMLVPKAAELIASNYRHGGKAAAKEHFESGMLETFSNIHRFVRDDYPLTIYYAFKQQDARFRQGESNKEKASTGWETMLKSLIKAGFTVVGTWPMRTERGARMNAIGTNALASSIVLVCRPRDADAPSISRRRFIDELKAKLPKAISEMRTGKLLPVDLAQASIGPGMAIYSRYSRVQETDGSLLTVRSALNLINTVLTETLHKFVGDVDEYTRFAFDWFQEHQFKEADAGSAELLATAKNTSLIGLQRAGLIKLGGGKVRLLHWEDYDPSGYDPLRDQRPTVWEGTHHLIERLNSHGETGAAMLLNKMPPWLAGAAQDLAFSLFDISDRNGWAQHARDYNGLIKSWQSSDGIASVAANLRDKPQDVQLL